jgi:hypothetical protein
MFEIFFSVTLILTTGKHKGMKEGCGKYIRVIQEACSRGVFYGRLGWEVYPSVQTFCYRCIRDERLVGS